MLRHDAESQLPAKESRQPYLPHSVNIGGPLWPTVRSWERGCCFGRKKISLPEAASDRFLDPMTPRTSLPPATPARQ